MSTKSRTKIAIPSELPRSIVLGYWSAVLNQLLGRHRLSVLSAKRGIQQYRAALAKNGVGDVLYHAPVEETTKAIVEGGYIGLTALGDKLAGLNLAETVHLKDYLKEINNVEPGVAKATSGFNVILEGTDSARKINVIKVVREVTGQGLAEAKATVEGGQQLLLEGVGERLAVAVREKLESAGARVTVSPS